jgi:hypothetical protein
MYSFRGGFMARPQKKTQERTAMSGMERLVMRVSGMINHPTAQHQRWVKVHRLETDGDREWEEMLSVVGEADGIELSFEDDDSVTIRWEAPSDEDRPVQAEDVDLAEAPAPF